jgi:hypothetical protein
MRHLANIPYTQQNLHIWFKILHSLGTLFTQDKTRTLTKNSPTVTNFRNNLECLPLANLLNLA